MSAPTHRARHAALALLLCLAGAAAVFAPALFGDGSVLSFDPAHPFYPRPWYAPPAAQSPDRAERPAINPITSDIDFFVLPGMQRVDQLADSPAGGTWDPGQLLGYPLRSNLPYPLHAPIFTALGGVEPQRRLAWGLALHTALAAWLAWRAARWLGADGAGAALAAVATALSVWMVTRWHLPNVACAGAWWGGVMVGVERVRRGQRALGAAEFALWGGLALRSGFPQIGLLVVVGGLAWAALRMGAPRLRPASWLLGGALGAAALGAPELAGVGAALDGALRTTPASQAATLEHGLDPGALWGALLPDFFGSPPAFASADPPAPRMEDWLPRRLLLSDDVQDNPVENALAPGLVVLALLPLAWAAGGAARALLLFAASWLGLALVFPWLVDVFPPARVLGTGSIKRVLVLWALALPPAAALGLTALARDRLRLPWRGFALLAAALLAAAALPLWVDDPAAPAWRARLWPQVGRALVVLALAALLLRGVSRGRRAAGAALVLLAGVELLAFALGFNPFTRHVERFPSTPGLARLAEEPGRVAVLGGTELLPPTATSLHGLRSVHGAAPLVPARTAELLACIEPGLVDVRDPRVVAAFRRPTSLAHPLLDLLGVSRVVFDDPGLPARVDLPVVATFPDEGFGVLARPAPWPPAMFHDAARVVPDAAERLALLADPSAPWRASVLLERDPGIALPERGAARPLPVLRAEPGAWTLDVQGLGDGVALVTESWHAGWHARLDGAAVPVLRADHALMGVAVPAGSRRLELRFELPGRTEARHLSWVGAAAVALAALLGAWQLRRAGEPPRAA